MVEHQAFDVPCTKPLPQAVESSWYIVIAFGRGICDEAVLIEPLGIALYLWPDEFIGSIRQGLIEGSHVPPVLWIRWFNLDPAGALPSDFVVIDLDETVWCWLTLADFTALVVLPVPDLDATAIVLAGCNALTVEHPATVSVQGFLEKHRGAMSRFVLLDHMNWFSGSDDRRLEAEWQAIVDRAAPGVRLIWRAAASKPTSSVVSATACRAEPGRSANC
jgi:hypothetical protein